MSDADGNSVQHDVIRHRSSCHFLSTNQRSRSARRIRATRNLRRARKVATATTAAASRASRSWTTTIGASRVRPDDRWQINNNPDNCYNLLTTTTKRTRTLGASDAMQMSHYKLTIIIIIIINSNRHVPRDPPMCQPPLQPQDLVLSGDWNLVLLHLHDRVHRWRRWDLH